MERIDRIRLAILALTPEERRRLKAWFDTVHETQDKEASEPSTAPPNPRRPKRSKPGNKS